ncbi:hypothetical protein SAMN05443432_109150 [Roseovarius litoreus]|jgi:hypothetical protein|uniref:Uncharacterized protein n=1 Tax=Roseovarius litoreus TaxID=1155722 RepID=A0A1M7K0N3_9RHOB|nr:hypothetical protein [Roseovarius litoreus]SHM58798.1 hypothetical protein SAMN05443432_109150 [Roseovarius litoreus]
MTLALTFLLIFGVGPALFIGLCRLSPDMRGVASLWVLAGGCTGLAFAVKSGAVTPGLGATAQALVPLAALWLAWIAVLALCMLAIRARVQDAATLRWAHAIGAMATTLPWFGLYTAQMVSER